MRFLTLLAMLFAANCLSAQTESKSSGRGEPENEVFIEPIFNDNVADYTDEPSEFELNYLPQVFGKETAYNFGQAFTLSGMVFKGVGVELEYAHFSPQFSDEAEINFQHSIVWGQFAFASGAGLGFSFDKKTKMVPEPNKPTDEGAEVHENELSAFLTLAWTDLAGLSVQANLTPQLEMGNGNQEFGLGYNAAAHMAFRDFNAGLELNGEASEAGHAIWFSPQATAFIGPFSIGVGVQVPMSASALQTNLTWKFVYEIE